jgi:NAD(P)-dependent dehydrogenase (short-subunit alcohol dehydrogenase family)
MLNSFPDDSRALVTGASRGIGLEFVRQLLADARFTRVLAGCRDPGRAVDLATLAATEPRLQLLRLDVADDQCAASAARAAREISDRLHLVVNCAGMLHDASAGVVPEKRLADVRPEALAASFAVNAFGPLLVAKYFEPLIARRERAVFASLSARVGSIGDNRLGGWYAYRGAKAAQNMFTKTLAIEWARSRRNVVCIALHPGTTDTGLSRPFQSGVPPQQLFAPERTVRQLLAVIDRLTPADTGRFFAWDGSGIPW